MANRDSKGSSKFVVVRQVWVKSEQTKAWFQAAGRVRVGRRRGSEPDKSKQLTQNYKERDPGD